ncbi:hypothetical protein [Pseudomonas sp. G2-4]|uniref:hypothetical protein n=1 Tax=Pseudomonas sp. G2-4 TaxID=1506334 RepID=UPI0024BB0C2E|nr:hypothetical protein [Pseudomonas sp. G2-4]WHS60815.1 hypothetical protein QNH97_01895 [Pseudomonas sp. G2-4]
MAIDYNFAMAQGDKFMKTNHSLSLYVISLSTIPIIGGYNLYSNLNNSLYATDHDIIIIPFTAMIGTLLLSWVLLLIQRPYRLRKSNNTPITYPTILASFISTLLTIIILIYQGTYWLSPNHFPIFGIILITLFFYIYYQLQLYGLSARPLRDR